MQYMMGLHFPESRHMQTVIKEDRFQQGIPGFCRHLDRDATAFRGLQKLKEKMTHFGIQEVMMFGCCSLENPFPEVQERSPCRIIQLGHATQVTGKLKGEKKVKKRKIISGCIQAQACVMKKGKKLRVWLFFMDGLVDKFIDEKSNGTLPDVEGNGLVWMGISCLL
jgi:hypothetical protein